MVDLSMQEAQERLGALVQRAASTRERVTISEAGRPAAVLINAEEVAEVDEAIALARYREAQANGDVHLVQDLVASAARAGLAKRFVFDGAMTYKVSWSEAALNSSGGHLRDDAAGVRRRRPAR